MGRTKIASVVVLRNAVPIVAAALLPVAVLRLPVRCAALLPDATLFGLLPVLLLRGLEFDLLRTVLLLGALLLIVFWLAAALLLLLFVSVEPGFWCCCFCC